MQPSASNPSHRFDPRIVLRLPRHADRGGVMMIRRGDYTRHATGCGEDGIALLRGRRDPRRERQYGERGGHEKRVWQGFSISRP